MKKLIFPQGKRFAFSIFDDTDVATLNSIKPIYDLLSDLKIYTTKTVWSLDHEGPSDYQGSDSLQNEGYLKYIQELKSRGFEISFHGAKMESAERKDIERSLEVFRTTIGCYPKSYAAHGMNRDNLYWGASRFTSSLWRRLYLRMSGEDSNYFQGHQKNSPFFWGDLGKQHLQYMRSFTFTDINLDNLNTPLVYRSDDFPLINNWFLTSDADNVEEFNNLLCEKNQERLESEGGICIISTHLGKGFVSKNGVHPHTASLLNSLSRRDGWFVPVSQLLDYYVATYGSPNLTKLQLFRLEAKWFSDAILRKLRRKSYHATETDFLLENQTQQKNS